MSEPFWTTAQMLERVVRYDDLVPCTTAFIDAKTPGSHLKENFTIIGGGVAENPDQYVHITERHGFNVGGARQPPYIKNSLHSHDTAEVFVVFKGTWRFYWGADGTDGEAVLTYGDTITLPTRLFRGFENVGPDKGFIFSVLGGDVPGRVTWVPEVLEAANGYGLVLLEDGRLIDTTEGQSVPADVRPARPLTDQEMHAFKHLGVADMEQYVVRLADLSKLEIEDAGVWLPSSGSELHFYKVVDPTAATPKSDWPHGFNLHAVRAESNVGAASELYSYPTSEVFIILSGSWLVDWVQDRNTNQIFLKAGDTFSCPANLIHSFSNIDEGLLFVVRGGDKLVQPQVAKQKEATV